MKKLLITLTLTFVAFTANAQKTNGKATQSSKPRTTQRTFQNDTSKAGQNISSVLPMKKKVKLKFNKKEKETLTRIITVNYKELVDALTKLDKEDPERTTGELNLLMDNIKNHLMSFLQDGILTIVVDENNGNVYVGGELITDDVLTIWPDAWGKDTSTSIKMYRQIRYSLDEARSYGIYEKVFTDTWSER